MPNVKGSALEIRFRWAEVHHGSAGLVRLLDALPKEDRAIHSNVILSSAWYPFETFVRVNTAIDAIFGKGDLALVPVVAEWAAGENLPTLYRFFYRVGSISIVLGMAARLWRMHYDAGTLVVDSGPKGGTLEIADWPEPKQVHCLAVLGWARRTAELSGETGVTAELASCRARGDATCAIAIAWR